jgi:signal transduction histidine kinase
VEVALLRIASEAMANVVRHAKARSCRIHLARHVDEVTLRVVDDGRGIVSAVEGAGIPSMRARAADLGGSCAVRHSSAGTEVDVLIPVAAP